MGNSMKETSEPSPEPLSKPSPRLDATRATFTLAELLVLVAILGLMVLTIAISLSSIA